MATNWALGFMREGEDDDRRRGRASSAAKPWVEVEE